MRSHEIGDVVAWLLIPTTRFINIAEAHNGIQIYFSSGNVETGTFTLYGLKK